MELTELINLGRAGDLAANDEAIARLYTELKAIAAAELRRQFPGTLNTTAVVHEAWEKLARYEGAPVGDRRHFLCLAARAMRQVVIDHARARGAQKRGSDAANLALEDVVEGRIDHAQQWLVLDDALRRLADDDERAARVVELHVFGGLTFLEIADALDVSERTARGDWASARAWLATELDPG